MTQCVQVISSQMMLWLLLTQIQVLSQGSMDMRIENRHQSQSKIDGEGTKKKRIVDKPEIGC